MWVGGWECCWARSDAISEIGSSLLRMSLVRIGVGCGWRMKERMGELRWWKDGKGNG